jgi:hypothetical protein
MARFLSNIFSTAFGSIGGITIWKGNLPGMIARARVIPVNPRTNGQTLIRSAFAAAANEWNLLTDAVRGGWEAYAATCPITDGLGQRFLSGREMFMGVFSFAFYETGLTGKMDDTDSDAPIIPGWLDIGYVVPYEYTGPGTGIALQVTYSGSAKVDLVFERSYAYNPARFRNPGKWLHSTVVTEEIQGPIALVQEFDDLSAGFTYFVKVRAITAAKPHKISNEYIVRCVAETVV